MSVRHGDCLGGGRYDGRWFEGEEALDATDLLGVYERVMGLIGYQVNLKPLRALDTEPDLLNQRYNF